MKVLLGARDVAAGQRAARSLRDADVVALDVTSPPTVRAAAARIEAEYGRLDILVNNAGILPEATEGTGDGPVSLEMFRRTFDTNLFGAVSAVEHFLPLLERAPVGRIVNVSSSTGSLAAQSDPSSPWYGVMAPAYQGSKAALNAFTVALAKALRDTSVKVNAVCPGWLQTDLGGPENRAAAPMTAAEGAEIIVAMAFVGADGPSGTFVDRDGPVAW